ncbi:hypothetical protein GCM10009603_35230 [Nocardiopsis exhalans]
MWSGAQGQIANGGRPPSCEVVFGVCPKAESLLVCVLPFTEEEARPTPGIRHHAPKAVRNE